jgi:hypothetical protein
MAPAVLHTAIIAQVWLISNNAFLLLFLRLYEKMYSEEALIESAFP